MCVSFLTGTLPCRYTYIAFHVGLAITLAEAAWSTCCAIIGSAILYCHEASIASTEIALELDRVIQRLVVARVLLLR